MLPKPMSDFDQGRMRALAGLAAKFETLMTDPDRAEEAEVWAEALRLVNEKAWSRPPAPADGEEGSSEPYVAEDAETVRAILRTEGAARVVCAEVAGLSPENSDDVGDVLRALKRLVGQPPDVEEGGREPGVDAAEGIVPRGADEGSVPRNPGADR